MLKVGDRAKDRVTGIEGVVEKIEEPSSSRRFVRGQQFGANLKGFTTEYLIVTLRAPDKTVLRVDSERLDEVTE